MLIVLTALLLANPDPGARLPDLAAEIEQAQEVLRDRIVHGRVIVEGADPREVTAQMPIARDGSFKAEIGDPMRPLSFRLHGYEPIDVSIEEAKEVILKRPSPSEQTEIHGRIRLQDPTKGEPRVLFMIALGPINSPNGGYRSRRFPHITVPVKADGRFSMRGFSSAKYHVCYGAPGHVAQWYQLILSKGVEDLGKINLELQRSFRLEAQEDGGPLLKRRFHSGERWLPFDRSSSLRFVQLDGAIYLDPNYGYFSIIDLSQPFRGEQPADPTGTDLSTPRSVPDAPRGLFPHFV